MEFHIVCKQQVRNKPQMQVKTILSVRMWFPFKFFFEVRVYNNTYPHWMNFRWIIRADIHFLSYIVRQIRCILLAIVFFRMRFVSRFRFFVGMMVIVLTYIRKLKKNWSFSWCNNDGIINCNDYHTHTCSHQIKRINLFCKKKWHVSFAWTRHLLPKQNAYVQLVMCIRIALRSWLNELDNYIAVYVLHRMMLSSKKENNLYGRKKGLCVYWLYLLIYWYMLFLMSRSPLFYYCQGCSKYYFLVCWEFYY